MEKIVNYGLVEKSSDGIDERLRLNWAIEHNLGEMVRAEDILEGKYWHYHFATWG